jgi:hypothetical protein
MPFEEGNKLSPGRKGYELEQEQLELMRNIVSKDLEVVKKIYEGIADEKDFKTLQSLQVRIGKYLDKLHASKSDSKVEVSIPQSLVDLIKLIRKQDEPTK